MIKGTLIPIGGNEDKGVRANEKYTLEYIEESILARVVKESGGEKSLIVVIPTASLIPKEISHEYQKAFEKLGAHIEVLDIRERKESEKKEYAELVKKADCVLFTGGDQSNIIEKIADTPIHKILVDRYRNEEFVLAGTSAGAMAMSEEMIAGSNPKRLFTKGALKMTKGLGFISDFIIDSHFIKRRRFGRLAGAMAKFPNYIGIGLDEDTGLVIKNGSRCESIGSGMVILFDPRQLDHNSIDEVAPGGFISLTNLTTHILAPGDCFDINHKIKFIKSGKEWKKHQSL